MASAQVSTPQAFPQVKHVLLISVDGLHEQDLRTYVAAHPKSALAALSNAGITYSHAYTSAPSDSFVGALALVTGGTPKSTGVYYDDSYDRKLAAPGSDCTVLGTEALYDDSIDIDPDALGAGAGIDPKTLPRNPANKCAPVYPHEFVRINTIFEVAKAAGLRTAWSDKHPAYELVQGPSGKGVDDMFMPEITNSQRYTASVGSTAAYDALKVQAILNQINGKTSLGERASVPAIFGMNFQAMSVATKAYGPSNGYSVQDGQIIPGPDVNSAMAFVNASLGQMLQSLKQNGLMDSTMIIIGAKHAQGPMDRTKLGFVAPKELRAVINSAAPAGIGQLTLDDVGLLWLKDGTQADAVLAALNAHRSDLKIDHIISGAELRARFGDPAQDSRVPDLIIEPTPGIIYLANPTKLAEHGGFSEDATHVGLLISAPGLKAQTIDTPVGNIQVAPTILRALGLDPMKLQAVQQEGTTTLPLK